MQTAQPTAPPERPRTRRRGQTAFANWATAPHLAETTLDPAGVGARACLREMQALLKRGGVTVTPLVVLRLRELLTVTLLVHAIERDVFERGAVVPDEKDPKKPGVLHPFLEPLAKWHERQRKAARELEEACDRHGTPLGTGLADLMKPILRQTEGVLEAALVEEN